MAKVAHSFFKFLIDCGGGDGGGGGGGWGCMENMLNASSWDDTPSSLHMHA